MDGQEKIQSRPIEGPESLRKPLRGLFRKFLNMTPATRAELEPSDGVVSPDHRDPITALMGLQRVTGILISALLGQTDFPRTLKVFELECCEGNFNFKGSRK